jgi:hypothetical protein
VGDEDRDQNDRDSRQRQQDDPAHGQAGGTEERDADDRQANGDRQKRDAEKGRNDDGDKVTAKLNGKSGPQRRVWL